MARNAAVLQPVKATVLLGVDSVPQMRTGLVVSLDAGSGVSLSLAQNSRYIFWADLLPKTLLYNSA